MNKNKYQKNPKPIKEQEKKKQENSEPKRCEKSSAKKRI